MAINPAYVTDIESQVQPTHDERARQSFVSTVRKHAIIDMRSKVQEDWTQRVAPALAARGTEVRNWKDIQQAMENGAVVPLLQLNTLQRPGDVLSLGAAGDRARAAEDDCARQGC